VKLRLELLLRNPMKIMQNLGTLPTSVHDAYRRLLDRTTVDREYVFKILSWIYYAKRPLEMDELREAIVVEPEDKTLNRDFLPSPDMVIECCEGLVVWERGEWGIDTVRFSHSTVRDFVFNEGLLPLNYITRICLTYLSFEDFEAPLDEEVFRERFHKYKFASFAALNWHIYIKGEGVEADEKVQIAFWRLVASRTKRESMIAVYQIMLTAGNETSLHLIARFGLNSLYQLLLVEEKGRAAYFKKRMPELERDKLAMLVEEIEDVSAKDLEGWTPLHHAADTGNKEVIVLLLSNGANIEAVDNKGRTALYYASGSLKTIEFLVKHGANIKAKDNDGSTALHSAAARFGSSKETVRWLVKLGADVNARDNDGRTALHSAAARFGNRDILKWLVKHGADVNARDNDGRTALHSAAATFGNRDTLKWLVKLGADVNARDNDGRTALHSAAATFDSWGTVKWLLKLGADVNARNNEGRTVLHLAVSLAKDNNKGWEVVKLLVEHGADVNAGVDGEGTVLGYVASFTEDDKDWEVVKWLVEHGADVTEKNRRGWTLLHSAVSQDNLEAVKWLVQCGIDVNIKNNDGFTALRYTEDLEVRNWLVEHGAIDSE